MGEGSLKVGLKRFLGVIQIQQRGDAGVDMVFHRCEPDGVQMALNEVPVAEVKGWSLDYAMHHLVRVMEEPLIVRAHSGRVSHDQGGLA